ncbi:hypothetical protein AB0B50_06715 [Streptomyces sp. NPDC041068]|uniref:hypothetical protein n=1 Tax=Streptomyces sp. NPDC041068 TaxID=3155130 RepID=UPI003406C994
MFHSSGHRSRLLRTASLAAAVAVVAALAGPAAAASATPVSARAAAPASLPGDTTPIASGPTSLEVDSLLDLEGAANLKVGGGNLIHSNNRITGGTVRLSGSVTLKAGNNLASVKNISIDIATGTVRATVAGKAMILGTIDTSSLRLRSEPGSDLLYVVIGLVDDNNIVLGADAAARLHGILGVQLEEGDTLLTGSIGAAVVLDAALAADLSVDLDAAVAAGLDVDVELNADIDVSLDLDLGLSVSIL